MEKSEINFKEKDKDEIVVGGTKTGNYILTPETVKKYICKTATEEEIYVFLKICEAQNLNPFLREIYLVKYGSKAQYIVGKETFLKRAQKNPKFRGFEAGTKGEAPNMIGWATVHVKGYKVPVQIIVHYSEYKGAAPIWKEKPKTMLRKVALMQALREAFPDDLGGLYDASEISSMPDELSDEPINVEVTDQTEVEKKNNLGGSSSYSEDGIIILGRSKEEPLKFRQGQYSGQLVSEVTDIDYLKRIAGYEGEYQKPCLDRLLSLLKNGREYSEDEQMSGRVLEEEKALSAKLSNGN